MAGYIDDVLALTYRVLFKRFREEEGTLSGTKT